MNKIGLKGWIVIQGSAIGIIFIVLGYMQCKIRRLSRKGQQLQHRRMADDEFGQFVTMRPTAEIYQVLEHPLMQLQLHNQNQSIRSMNFHVRSLRLALEPSLQ